jgi:DHA1 family bicyclomycin/chloramphenicol resistance-like MFS transporter
MPQGLLVKQRYLGNKGLIVLLTLLSSFVPMSTDIYLPALPLMVKQFETSASLINMTLIVFFLFYGASALVFGPLSDKYGRKPILSFGLLLYVISSILCAIAFSAYQLVIFRIFQALGSGSISSATLAIVKDSYDEEERLTILAIIQSMSSIAPIVAPVIGAFVIKFVGWRGVFIVLTLLGLASLLGVLLMSETNVLRNEINVIKALGRLGFVLKNVGFTYLLITFSLSGIAFMAYVSGSSYIFIEQFGLNEQQFSYYFAANATVMISGPLLYVKLHKYFSNNFIIVSSFIIMTISGLLLFFFGSIAPIIFLLALIPSSIVSGIIRPPSTNYMFEQVEQDAGSVSSLMSCSFMFMGSIGMFIISFDWHNRVLIIGILMALTALLSLALWFRILKKSLIKK